MQEKEEQKMNHKEVKEKKIYSPQVNDRNDTQVKLKENKIENNFCRICKVNIASRISRKTVTQTAQGDLERQDSKKVNMIITSLVQVTKKNMINMNTIRNANKFIYTNLKFRIILIENLKKLPSLLPVDHSMITACELWLTSIHQEVYLA